MPCYFDYTSAQVGVATAYRGRDALGCRAIHESCYRLPAVPASRLLSPDQLQGLLSQVAGRLQVDQSAGL